MAGFPYHRRVAERRAEHGGDARRVPNTGVMRGVVIGVAIGVLATFVRSLLGLETSYMGGD